MELDRFHAEVCLIRNTCMLRAQQRSAVAFEHTRLAADGAIVTAAWRDGLAKMAEQLDAF